MTHLAGVDVVLLAVWAAYLAWVSRAHRGSPVNLFRGRTPRVRGERWLGAVVNGVVVGGYLFGTDGYGWGTRWVNLSVLLAALTVMLDVVQAVMAVRHPGGSPSERQEPRQLTEVDSRTWRGGGLRSARVGGLNRSTHPSGPIAYVHGFTRLKSAESLTRSDSGWSTSRTTMTAKYTCPASRTAIAST